MIEKNQELDLDIRSVIHHAPKLNMYRNRPPITVQSQDPHESRFDSFERNPPCLNKHVCNIDLQKFTARDLTKTLLPVRDFQNDYDRAVSQKDKILKNLVSGAVDFKKKSGR